MAKYEFVTIWRFKSPLAPVWEMIYNSDRWPVWWKGVERVERLKEGDENSIGSIHRSRVHVASARPRRTSTRKR